jgi:hypothetical protein
VAASNGGAVCDEPPNLCENNVELVDDELAPEADRVNAGKPESLVAMRVAIELFVVNRPVDLHGEIAARREEIDDVAPNRSLTPESHAKLSVPQLAPKDVFFVRHSSTKKASVKAVQRGARVVTHARRKARIRPARPPRALPDREGQGRGAAA